MDKTTIKHTNITTPNSGSRFATKPNKVSPLAILTSVNVNGALSGDMLEKSEYLQNN